MNDLIDHISTKIGDDVLSAHSISGGDISQAYLISTAKQKFFLKVNSGLTALEMFQAEEEGLKVISETGTIATPSIYFCNLFNDQAYLVMEHIETISPSPIDLIKFGNDLAGLHQSYGSGYGFKSDNFIGSLPQHNEIHDNWSDFYIKERLAPQLKMSGSKGLMTAADIPGEDRLMRTCTDFFGDIKPSLLHGDLWSGNYLISKDGVYLIDPAVYYGHHEVDIAMTKLFGGFGTDFYNSYHEQFPKTEGFEDRMQIYQLYYLLVHLNLFGMSYYPSVKRILTRFF